MKNFGKYFLIGLLAFFAFGFFASLDAFAQKGTNVEKRVRFARGKSSATMKGTIADRMTTHEYKIGARAGQTLTVRFVSPRKDVDVCIVYPNGGEPENSCGRRSFSVRLPDDGDYSIIIDSKRENTAYTLTVSVK
ncbi:MAG: hypothetical protein M3384_09145 [Acidobacteriota bacterium]|nr:hypothetical protein [Acidobacteriota bacterium]